MSAAVTPLALDPPGLVIQPALIETLLAGLAIATAAGAQAYLAKPLRVIVPSVPGGNLDLVGRTMSQQIAIGLRQQVVVENRAGSTIGARLVAKSPPDGYNLLMVSNSFVIRPSVIADAGYDPVKDFAAVSMVGYIPLILVVNPALPVRDVKSFIALAKTHPGQLTYGGSGIGSLGHIAGELMARQAGVRMTHVPYKGNAQSLVDLAAGQISFMLDQISSSAPYVIAGKLRALGVSTLKRSPLFPDVPTIDEAGLPGYQSMTYNGVVAPAGTSREVLMRLHAEIVKAAQDKDFKSRFAKQGVDAAASASPDEFAAYLRDDFAKMAKLVREAGIRAGD